MQDYGQVSLPQRSRLKPAGGAAVSDHGQSSFARSAATMSSLELRSDTRVGEYMMQVVDQDRVRMLGLME